MKKCVHCGGKTFEKVTEELRHKVAGHAYIMNALDVPKCSQCGEVYLPGLLLGSFELLVAWDLISHGVMSGEVLRFTRKALGLRAAELATTLALSPEHFSKWENDHEPINANAMALVAEMVNDRLHNRTTTIDLLKAMKEPKPIARGTVKLEPLPEMKRGLAATG